AFTGTRRSPKIFRRTLEAFSEDFLQACWARRIVVKHVRHQRAGVSDIVTRTEQSSIRIVPLGGGVVEVEPLAVTTGTLLHSQPDYQHKQMTERVSPGGGVGHLRAEKYVVIVGKSSIVHISGVFLRHIDDGWVFLPKSPMDPRIDKRHALNVADWRN